MAGSATVNFSSLLPIPPQIPVKGSANYAISVGGEGGTGGQAGAVTVSNDGAITTHEDYSYGIFAQSVGGGGGAGGRSIAATGNVSLPEGPEGGGSKPQLEVKLDFALAVGGKGGDGNTGGAVEIVNRGAIETSGVGSHGIFAQSVGGGGGEGGSARALTVSIDPSNWSPQGSPPSLSVSKAVNIGVGGSAGGGSDGGSVTIDNARDITTRGADAHGIFAQSIGGGGGAGGSGYHGLDWADLGVPEDLVPYFELLPIKSEGDLQIVAGGSGGSSGSGRDVVVKNEGRIVTRGDGSFGILAQSVGGGGGTAGIGAVGDEGTVGIGGGGGAAGDGGAVRIEMTGDIETSGKAAHAIFAQSVGGGGGIAGNVDRGVESFGTNLAFGRDGGSSGDGGTVTVTSTGSIITRGTAAYGIFAQSVGGGGGLAGDIGPGIGFAGSTGGDGSAGEVTIAHTGSIATHGDSAHGIFAQSVGGQSDAVLQQTVTLLPDGKLKKDDNGNVVFGAPVRLADRFDGGGPIAVTVNGDVAAHGRNSHGIFAQSFGDDGNGNISIDVLGGTVQGGSGSGAGIYIADGSVNTLANRGTIMTVDGIGGTAIRGTTGNDTVENYGTVTGSVALGAGRNAFNNLAGATLNTGAAVDLGLGNALTNRGTLSPGGRGALMTTALTGDFVQGSAGILEVEVRKDGAHDKLSVNGGVASLDGTLSILRGPGPYRNGTTYEILEAAHGIREAFANLLPLAPGPLLRFDVRQSSNIVELHVYAPSFATVATNPTHRRIARHLDAIMPSATGDMADVLGEFQALPAGGFDRAFASLGPMAYDNLTRATVWSARQYTQSLHRRLDAVRILQRTAGVGTPATPVLLAAAETDTTLVPILGTYRLSQTQAKNGLWLTGFGQWDDQETTPGFAGFTAGTGGLTLGYDRTFGDHFTAGVSVGYSYTDVDQAENQSGGRIQGVFPSLYASYFTRAAYVEGALSYGHNWYRNARNVVIGGIQRTAKSEHEGDALGLYLGAGYAHPVGNWALGPIVALEYVYLKEGGFEETGADSLNLTVASRGTNSLVSEVGVRITGTLKTAAGALIPDLSLLWSYDFDVDDRVLTTTYAGAPGAAFSIQGQPTARSGLAVRPGLTFVHPGGWSTMLRYSGEFRDDYQSHAVFGEVRIEF
jgi:outer membrane autotransporter protein